MSIFSSILKELRTQSGHTQESLAKALGVSKSRINMYERGDREPNFEMLESFADFFNVDMNFLLGKNTSQPNNNNSNQNITPELKEFFDACRNANSEDIKLLTEMLKRMSEGKQ